MGAGGEKFTQSRRRERNRVWSGDADDIEAGRSRGGEDIRFNGGEI